MDLTLLAEKEYFSIGEVGQIAGVPPYVLRYWESRIGVLKPARRNSGQRKFTRRDVETILRIKELLYDRGFTVEGAKKHLRQTDKRGPVQRSLELADSGAAIGTLREVKKEVSDLIRILKKRDYQPAEPI